MGVGSRGTEWKLSDGLMDVASVRSPATRKRRPTRAIRGAIDRWCSGADGSAIIYTASFSKETSPPSRDRPPRGALDFMGIYEPQPAEIDSPASRNHGQPMLVMPEGFSPFANTRTSGRKKKLANIVVPYRVTDEKQ